MDENTMAVNGIEDYDKDNPITDSWNYLDKVYFSVSYKMMGTYSLTYKRKNGSKRVKR